MKDDGAGSTSCILSINAMNQMIKNDHIFVLKSLSITHGIHSRKIEFLLSINKRTLRVQAFNFVIID